MHLNESFKSALIIFCLVFISGYSTSAQQKKPDNNKKTVTKKGSSKTVKSAKQKRQTADADLKERKSHKRSKAKTGRTLYGEASFYSNKFHGRKTSNGEKLSQQKFTAACNALPLGTWVQITNLRNGKIAVVKTNDHLNVKTTRLIDVTKDVAKKLDFVNAGLTRVKVIVLDQSLYK